MSNTKVYNIKSHIIGSLYRIKTSVSYLDITIIKKIENLDFNDIKKILMNQKNINNVFKMIYSIYKYLFNTYPLENLKKPFLKQARIFLSHIMINVQPDILLGEEKTRTAKTRKLHKETIILFNY